MLISLLVLRYLKRIRSAVALAVGLFLTVAVATLTYVFAYKHGPWLWSRLSRIISHGLLAGIRYRVEDDIDTIYPGELVVVYANHPGDADLSEFVDYLTHILGMNPVYVAKADLYLPIRLAVKRIGVGVFIDRTNGPEAKTIIHELAEQAKREHSVLVIFPNSSRWTYEKRDRDRTRYADVPHINELTEHALVPHTGGLFELLDVLKDERIRLIEITNGLSVRVGRRTEMLDLSGSTFHIYAEDVRLSSIPSGKGAQRAWLNRRFLAMSRRLASWRQAEKPATEATSTSNAA